ncbi:TPA: hypothetical protein F7027_08975 [Legionella pneumophila]|nr:hypothetical protein [Legionella pneumophila]HAU3496677.1 hypothetical protein [Legionella pneumophila]HDO7916821.1 hypothetical protein [Legionella pneumophila]HDO7929374.1 hypothetical protein [Legionella pneumophila]HDO8012011.1 hypothetical protein [Legionella pneumophila]
MNGLTINDLGQILSLAIEAKYAQESVDHIKKYLSTLRAKSAESRELTENEINRMAADKNIKFLMILFFLTKNVSLEFLRKQEAIYEDESILVSELWANIENLVKKKMLLSREINSYFDGQKDKPSERFNKLINIAKTIKINDLVSEEFVSNTDGSIFCLYITGKYKFLDSFDKKWLKSASRLYTLHDRKTCFHAGLYDPFKFEESQTWASHRYLNTSPAKRFIDSVFTLKFALPELTVLNQDDTFMKIQAKDIPDFLERNLKNNEISLDLYQAVKKDYPKLFLPPLDLKTSNMVYQNLKQLITCNLQEAEQVNKPLLILLSEVHGAKESFLFHVMILLIANDLGINHLLVETINVYHEQHGWDAHVSEIKQLISFAKASLGMQFKDLEGELHYNNLICAYPYHEIPEPNFGIEARESSWIIDAEEIKDNKVMIVGSGHLNNLLNSSLKERHYIVPIDCTGDKEFSELLSISQHHFISLDKNVSHLSLDEIIEMSEKCSTI